MRCLIAAGGTAGHVLPAIAVGEALRERGVRVTFAGSPERAEARLVPEAGFELDTFRIVGLPRRPGLPLARALGVAAAAPLACFRILGRRRPDVVLGAGGYVAGPMVAAAATRRIPAALTEADAYLGLANRLAAPFAKRVFLSFPIEGLRPPKYVVTGRPIPATSRAHARAAARVAFGLPQDARAVLVFGGSQGASALNELAVDAWGKSGPPVLHVSGERDYAGLVDRVGRDDYVLRAYVPELGAAYGAADLAVSRAGGSVWELAAAGVPAVLVPYPHATADHQRKNAEHFVPAGGALMVDQKRLHDVPDIVQGLLADERRLGEMAEAMRRLAKPDAADVIAEELIRLATA